MSQIYHITTTVPTFHCFCVGSLVDELSFPLILLSLAPPPVLSHRVPWMWNQHMLPSLMVIQHNMPGTTEHTGTIEACLPHSFHQSYSAQQTVVSRHESRFTRLCLRYVDQLKVITCWVHQLKACSCVRMSTPQVSSLTQIFPKSTSNDDFKLDFWD